MTLDQTSMDFPSLFERHGQLLKFDKGGQIFQEGEFANEIYLVNHGNIQLSKETESGKELTFRICGKSSIRLANTYGETITDKVVLIKLNLTNTDMLISVQRVEKWLTVC